MSEGNQASAQCADHAPLNASPLGLIFQFFGHGNRPICGQRMEGAGTAEEDESINAELPKADVVLGNFANEIRSLWDDTSTELKVGAVALAAFGLGVYIGKRTR